MNSLHLPLLLTVTLNLVLKKCKGYVVVFCCLSSKGYLQEKGFFFNKLISVPKQGVCCFLSEEQLSHLLSLLNCVSESLDLSSSLLSTRKAYSAFRCCLFDIVEKRRMLVLTF